MVLISNFLANLEFAPSVIIRLVPDKSNLQSASYASKGEDKSEMFISQLSITSIYLFFKH